MRRIFWGIAFLFYTIAAAASEIAVVTIVQGAQYKERVNFGIENKRAYCQQHGYDFICCEDSLDPFRPIPWSKILLVLNTMENAAYRWIVWMDADTIIMNLDIPLEYFIEDKYNFIIAKDIQKSLVNSGVFFIKNCEWSQEFMEAVYAHTEFIHHQWWEQMGINKELEDPTIRSQTKIAPPRLFNAWAAECSGGKQDMTYRRGDFLIHFPSKRGDVLKSLFDKYSQLIVNDRNLLTLD